LSRKPWEKYSDARHFCARKSNCARRCGRPLVSKAEKPHPARRIAPDISGEISGRWPPVLELIGQIGPSDANVLITGEHGTGKEVCRAKLFMRCRRVRRRPMVTVNGRRAIGRCLRKRALRSRKKGPLLTRARRTASGGSNSPMAATLFLDEIANVSTQPAGQTFAAFWKRGISSVSARPPLGEST